MTRSEDLQTWLKTNIPALNSTAIEQTEVSEADCPCALVQYAGEGDGAVMDADARIEKYHVTLMTNTAGCSETEKMSGIAILERALVQKVSGTERQNARWDHITCQLIEAARGDGRAEYEIDLHVTGE